MILASQQHIVPHLTKLGNNIVAEEKIPKDWNLSHIMSCYKGKNDPLVTGNYRGLKLLDHVMKFVERVIESIIRFFFFLISMRYSMVSCLAVVPWTPYSFFDECTRNISENISHSILLS